MKTKLRTKIALGLFMWLVLLVIYLPIFLLIVFSFSTTETINLNNFNFGMGVWMDLFANERLMTALLNTVIIATVASFVSVLIATMACVGIMKMRRRPKGVIMTVNQAPIINADIVTSFSLVILFSTLGFANIGMFRLILAHILICLPFSVLVILPRLRSLDQNLYEAAQDLGATPGHALFSVIIPQLLPAMIGAFLLGFTLSLDDFIITQFNRGDVETISVFVYNATKVGPPAELRALSALLFGTVLLILLFVNFYVLRKWRKKKLKMNHDE